MSALLITNRLVSHKLVWGPHARVSGSVHRAILSGSPHSLAYTHTTSNRLTLQEDREGEEEESAFASEIKSGRVDETFARYASVCTHIHI